MNPFKIFLNESIFSKNIIPNYAAFLKKEDPDLYQQIVKYLEIAVNHKREITEQDFNVEIENYLYNSTYKNNFNKYTNEKLINYIRELVELKTNPKAYENIPTGKRKRKRIRLNRL